MFENEQSSLLKLIPINALVKYRCPSFEDLVVELAFSYQNQFEINFRVAKEEILSCLELLKEDKIVKRRTINKNGSKLECWYINFGMDLKTKLNSKLSSMIDRLEDGLQLIDAEFEFEQPEWSNSETLIERARQMKTISSDESTQLEVDIADDLVNPTIGNTNIPDIKKKKRILTNRLARKKVEDAGKNIKMLRYETGHMRLVAEAALLNDFKNKEFKLPKDCHAGPTLNVPGFMTIENSFKWKATIQGPEETPYAGGEFELELDFQKDYRKFKKLHQKFFNNDNNFDVFFTFIKNQKFF